ncbi:MAG TPA: tRNA pseudouridine(38-40) synthase TruA [Acidobacteriota bacterium]|nr:tRNA pseudouridine(38-40) synthase TruA [Acidobacteriota bacterium]
MPRYRLDCAYHGAQFHGWQRQSDLRTVQGELELWLGRVLRAEGPVPLVGAGRTDTGVHAEQMVAHFDRDCAIPVDRLAERLNAALPPDLAVHRVIPVDDDFHARYSATARTYVYRIATQRTPFGRDRSWYVPHDLDYDRLCAVAAVVLGEHDCAGLCRAESRKDDNRCRVDVSEWQTRDGFLMYRIRARRFLHEMVRLLVGTYAGIAAGRLPPDRIGDIFATGDVRLCGDAAPAHGLTLVSVDYGGGGGAPGDLG